MILQALVKYYEDLAARGEISKPGWGPAKISYALCINREGQLEHVISLKEEVPKGKKTALLPRTMMLPAAVKRTVGISSNFLWDNAAYILGMDEKGNPERAKRCFAACRQLHLALLQEADSPGAKALLRFFEDWNPDAAKTHPALQAVLADESSGANFVFRFEGQFLHGDPSIQAAWQAHYGSAEDGTEMTCLVTGRRGPVALLHPAIKGIQGAQSSGASLVSFNAPAFCSYDREQGLNAPTGEYAAFAYGAVLNQLISDREHVFHIGDTTVLCWADGGEPAYQGMMGCCCFGAACSYTQAELNDMMKALTRGQKVDFDETLLDPERPFYVLGLAPNAARLSVRFFLRNSFGEMLRHVWEHYRRLEIARPASEQFESIPLWRLLDETVNQNSRDKSPSPELAGEMLRAILTGGRYPATLLNGVTLRIRADHQITRGRAAIIKAYYLRNQNPDVPEEVLQVSLNRESSNIPYNLGRLFSVLEAIQSAANPNINTTIKDKFFGSASATPAVVFPSLINLAQKHLRKLDGGLAVTCSRQLEEIMEKLPEQYPARLSLPEQGSFQLGYYHQTIVRYQGNKK